MQWLASNISDSAQFMQRVAWFYLNSRVNVCSSCTVCYPARRRHRKFYSVGWINEFYKSIYCHFEMADHNSDSDSEQEEKVMHVPSRSKRLKTGRENVKRLIIVLEKSQLETAKVGKSYELLCSDKHAAFLKKLNKDPANYRPDITHQCLLMLLDSPLNRAGHLQIYIHTANHVLIYVSPQTRIPRTYDRFAGLMVQLLHKLRIRASEGSQVLMKVIKNPVESHFPIGIKKFATSFHCQQLVDVRKTVPPDESVCLVVGAMAHGSVNTDYCEEEIKISSYPLSAALTCTKVCSAVEEVWNVL